MRALNCAVGRGDRNRHGVGGVEDGWGVGVGVLIIRVAGELGESHEGGIAGGVSGGDARNERLRNEEVLSCMFPTGSEDATRLAPRVVFIGSGILTFRRRGSSPGRGNRGAPREEGFCKSGFDPLAFCRKCGGDEGIGDGTACWRLQ